MGLWVIVVVVLFIGGTVCILASGQYSPFTPLGLIGWLAYLAAIAIEVAALIEIHRDDRRRS